MEDWEESWKRERNKAKLKAFFFVKICKEKKGKWCKRGKNCKRGKGSNYYSRELITRQKGKNLKENNFFFEKRKEIVKRKKLIGEKKETNKRKIGKIFLLQRRKQILQRKEIDGKRWTKRKEVEKRKQIKKMARFFFLV